MLIYLAPVLLALLLTSGCAGGGDTAVGSVCPSLLGTFSATLQTFAVGMAACIQAAPREDHRLGGLHTTDIYFSQSWGLEGQGRVPAGG